MEFSPMPPRKAVKLDLSAVLHSINVQRLANALRPTPVCAAACLMELSAAPQQTPTTSAWVNLFLERLLTRLAHQTPNAALFVEVVFLLACVLLESLFRPLATPTLLRPAVSSTPALAWARLRTRLLVREEPRLTFAMPVEYSIARLRRHALEQMLVSSAALRRDGVSSRLIALDSPKDWWEIPAPVLQKMP
ncbi:hypothetical protein BC829DRAFT_41924 [Chytridium lagenaria]|nr:hypothetical protein BC829DRAFT_41924 [Chytridium lagenaria]